jgi:hypothetical protein
MFAPNGQRLEPHFDKEFLPPPPENADRSAAMTIVLQIAGMTFPEAGTYTMRTSMDGHELKALRLEMVEVPTAAADATTQVAVG